MNCTPLCENFWNRTNPGPPHSATPCLCTVARKFPRGDHCTYDSVQKSRLYTSTGSLFCASFQWISVLSPNRIAY